MPDRNIDGTLSILLISSVFLTFPAWASDVEVQLGAGDGFVIKDSAAAERWRVDESGNLTRSGSLFLHEASSSVFLGPLAGSANSGSFNSAFGAAALDANTTASNNSSFGYDSLGVNSTGSQNSAFGALTLDANTLGNNNSAFGYASLSANATGLQNSAFGTFALDGNTTASDNSAFGYGSLGANSTGHQNSAFGSLALDANTTEHFNSAFGSAALGSLTSGDTNIAVGRNAGIFLQTGSNNIYIGNAGLTAESGKIRIGLSAHTETFIEGIDGNTATGGVAVLINSSNELHTLVSSARFKQDVHEMGPSSEVLMHLRPVTFRYRANLVGEGGGREYGLIAEEVAEVAPELVALDAEGQPYSVRYHVLPAMLLNEVQKQQRTIEAQKARIESQTAQLAQQQQRMAALTARVERLEAGPQLAWVEPIR